jgi:hypothetical protein
MAVNRAGQRIGKIRGVFRITEGGSPVDPAADGHAPAAFGAFVLSRSSSGRDLGAFFRIPSGMWLVFLRFMALLCRMAPQIGVANMFVYSPQGMVLRFLLLLSVMGVFAVSGSEARAGVPRGFEVEPGSEVRIWVTQEVGGVVQPPSIGQPPSVSGLSGSVAADKEGEFWTLTNVDMRAEDLTVSFLYPMADLSFVNSTDLVGFEDDSILSLVASACTGCTDFAVDFGYTFGTRPPVSQPIVDPLEFAMGLEPMPAGDVLRLSGVAVRRACRI